MSKIYILGGAQTDFARNFSREGEGLFEMIGAAVDAALDDASVTAEDIDVGHVGNFTGELFSGQGHLGGMLASLRPQFDGLPTSRHEAACASGSVAALASTADLECGRHDVALVVGVEQMRNVPGATAAEHLGAAAWAGLEGQGAKYLWPAMFSRLAQEYQERYGLDYEHLMAFAKQAFDNARRNPRAQTRGWQFTDASFTSDDAANPPVEGLLRRQDCAQITDGAAAVVLATEDYARRWAERTGTDLDAVAQIRGFGHRTSRMLLEEKLQASRGGRWVFPQLRATLEDAWKSAGISGVDDVSCLEVHDCFSITGYMIVDHLGIAEPGKPGPAIAKGDTAIEGRLPINPSGGLIGGGHPVGATGIRMLLDAQRQVTGRAGDNQVPGARLAQTLNIGGSCTTSVSFVVGRG